MLNEKIRLTIFVDILDFFIDISKIRKKIKNTEEQGKNTLQKFVFML